MPQPSGSATQPAVADVNMQIGKLHSMQIQRDMIAEQYQRAIAERGRVSQERMNAQARGDAAMVREYDAAIERQGKRVQDLERAVQKADQRIDEAMQASTVETVIPGTPDEPITVVGAPLIPTVPTEALIAQRIEMQRIMVIEGVGLLLLGALLWRFGFARGKRAGRAMSRELPQAVDTQREERLQQAIDAIAIEVERLSEGQRFTNTLLSSRRNEREALPATPNRITTPNDGTRITPH